MNILEWKPEPQPFVHNPEYRTRFPIGRQVVHAQARFLGYRDALEAHGGTLWLCASQRESVGYRTDAVADAASLILPITLGTYYEVLDTLVLRLREWDERGVGRLSLPETLYATRPEEGTAKVGSHSKNGGVTPPTGRLLWADIDVDSGHTTPEGARYPWPTPEEGRRIAERIEWDLGRHAILVDSGSGGYQVYLRATDAVTDDDFKAYLIAIEEQTERNVDQSVVGRHGPVRVWGHNRAGEGKTAVKPYDIHREECGDRPILTAMPTLTSYGAAANTAGADGWRERYEARVGAQAVKRAAKATATTTARARVDVEAEGETPRTRMNRAVPASAYVEEVHGGEVSGDRIRLRADHDITVFNHDDGTEFISTFSPTTMDTLGLKPNEKSGSGAASATTYGLLKAVVGKDGAWRIACHFDGRFDGLLPWVAENIGDLAGATATLPAPKGGPGKARSKSVDRNLRAAFNSKFTSGQFTGKPSRRTAAEVIVRRYGDEAERVMRDLLGL